MSLGVLDTTADPACVQLILRVFNGYIDCLLIVTERPGMIVSIGITLFFRSAAGHR